MKLSLSETDRQSALEKADSVEKTSFEAAVSRSVSLVYKAEDDFYIWGPASVEVVDKENDKVRVEALEKALPQLLKRARLSYAHTDQIVGKILDGFETSEPVEVEINGETFERQSFSTDVLDLDKSDAPALYVAGEVYDDTEQAVNVREKIESGEVDSYSISGEALVTRKQVEGDIVYDDILELDLSAVTLCEEGMNQDAKFARITGDIEATEPVEVDKSYELQDGRISSPERVVSAVSKSADTDQQSTESTMTDEEQNEKSEEETPKLPDNAATKSFVKEQIEEEFEKRTDILVDALVDEFEKSTPDLVKEELTKVLPDEPLATKGYVDAKAETVVDAVLDELDEKSDAIEVAERPEKEGDDYEEDDEEEMEDEEEDEEEEEAPEPPEEDGGKRFSEQELKENLPTDVYDVVSEYLGTSKEEEAAEAVAEAEKEVDDQNELANEVEKILAGDGPTTPTFGMEDREQELEKQEEDEEGREQVDSSPALQNFDHHK